METTQADAGRAPIIAELRELIARIGTETTEIWTSGELNPDSFRTRVAPDFQGTQYAPWFDSGVWQAGRDGWLDGIRQAAAFYLGKGIRWETTPLDIQPRSSDEAIVVYRVDHFSGGDEPSARAIFLESWKRIDGEWHLHRHTSEKI